MKKGDIFYNLESTDFKPGVSSEFRYFFFVLNHQEILKIYETH